MTEMNLYTPGHGILQTHVTWEEIEKDMQQVLGTKATFGENKTVQNIGDGNGFMSKICLIHPDWQDEQEKENLPRKFIAKLSTALTMMSFSDLMSEEAKMDNFMRSDADVVTMMENHVKTFHNSEVRMYNLLAKYQEDRIPRPKIYFSKKFSEENPLKGYLLMEHIDDVATIHLWDNLTPEQLHQPLRSIAILQALTLKLTEEEKSHFFKKPLQEVFGMMFTDDMRDNMMTMMNQFGQERMPDLMKRLEANVKQISVPAYFDKICADLDIDPVVCHGDLWSTNVLWHRVDSELQVAALIDFQTSHMGNPAGDLARIFNCCLRAKDRRERQFELLETFYGFLLEELNGKEAPYTLEQLKEAYRRYIPIGAYIVVPMIGPMIDIILKNKDLPDQEKKKVIVFEKIETLIEDMLDYHETNMTRDNNNKCEK